MGIGAFIALVVLLSRYQNKVVPQMGSVAGVGITLNTIVSILATVGRACMLLPVAECINQQKWLWFSGSPRALTHLDTFDQGSRGAFGSVIMLWTINIRNLGSVGALLLILGLAVDPLSQQLLHYEKRLEPGRGDIVYLTKVMEYNTDLFLSSETLYDASADDNETLSEPPQFMKSAIQAGIYAQSSGIPDLAPLCPTGNCTWPSYASLEVCVRWADVSSKLQRSVVPAAGLQKGQKGQVATWSLDNRTLISNSVENARLNVSNAAKLVNEVGGRPHIEFSGTSAFDDSPAPLAHFFVTYINGSNSVNKLDQPLDGISNLGWNFSAIEFMLEWCVQEYKAEVKSGVLTTTKLKTIKDFQPDDFGRLTVAMAYNRIYRVPNSSDVSLPNYLLKTFRGSVLAKWISAPTKTSDLAEVFHSKLKKKYLNTNYEVIGPEDADVRTAMVRIVENVATSMNIAMRQHNTTPNQEKGTVWEEQTFVKVRWGWIAAPVMLAGFSVLFVVATIIQSSGQARRGMVWKSSSVPTLLALNSDLHKAVGAPSSLSKTECVLRGAKVSLSQDKQGGWRLHGS
ncbi:hypothetical protein DM02DRAFT_671773 [Periconia macrospinosa]|uniref:Uncharacterized protein n=1 Tax=Periconia macrospinosa TaxID=97972 RepID=A0A2V1DR94_9PLEO|nr:hypothetical protein DM02DRAFT_671773 [Periconia macrospinosa]